MTAAHEERSPSHVTRRLSVLPAVVGLLGVVWAVVGALAAGVGDGSQGGPLVTVIGALVLATVVSGSSAGLYAGLAVLVVAGLVAGDAGPERSGLLAIAIAVVVIHETVRFSLDARRPARLGPDLVASFLVRTLAVAATVAVLVVALDALAGGQPGHPAWIPIGLAVTGVPVLALAAAERLGRRSIDRPLARLAAALLVTVVVLGLAVLGARARSGIESSGPTDTDPVTTTTTTVVPAAAVDGQPAEFRRGLTLMFLIGATLIFGALYFALRRPEALFQLDDLEQDLDDHRFGLAPPGRADARSTVEVEDDDLARLLAGLRLDIDAETDPARAVRFAYANVERRLAALDLPREPAETEREYLTRAMARIDGGRPLAELTALFERARFGTAPVDESLRRQARTAIADLEGALDRAGAERTANSRAERTGSTAPVDGRR